MAKRNKDEDSMAEPQEQKRAAPVEPPEPKQVSPMTFFDDGRMAANSGGVRDFSPKRVAPGNDENSSEGSSD